MRLGQIRSLTCTEFEYAPLSSIGGNTCRPAPLKKRNRAIRTHRSIMPVFLLLPLISLSLFLYLCVSFSICLCPSATNNIFLSVSLALFIYYSPGCQSKWRQSQYINKPTHFCACSRLLSHSNTLSVSLSRLSSNLLPSNILSTQPHPPCLS